MLAVVALATFGLITAAAPQVRADKSHLVSIEDAKKTPSGDVFLVKGMAKVIEMPGPVSDIMVANPALVDVSALQSSKLYIVGLGFGTTNVMALDASGNVIRNLTVHVKVDDVAIQAMVHKLFPKEDVTVTALYDRIVLTGYVSTPDMSNKISDFVEQAALDNEKGGSSGGAGIDPVRNQMIVNLLKVAGEQQVLLKVKVIEASRDMVRDLGIETTTGGFITGGLDPLSGGVIDNTAGVTTAVGSGLLKDPLGTGEVLFNRNSAGLIGPIKLIIRALEENGLLNTLAEPNLTAISGETAGFLAGGEFPIPTSRDQNNNVVVTYHPFGVALNFKPIVLSNDRISMQLQTEVSSIDNSNSLSAFGVLLPGFSVRRAATTVELPSGGSLMIAGLLQSNVVENLRKLPGISNVPILGDLMSSRAFQRNESEMIVIVTAYLVKPHDDNHPDLQQKEPYVAASPLADAFANNIRHTYTNISEHSDLFKGNGGYGYLIK
ncbi:MAG TPA: type II and III secretion system protein family protein [Patescibacteria group bacterium]|nr:type II and III secretion system protein family protein [Patescibacteria group bacterium]